MDTLKTLHIFLEKDFKASAEKGTHNFMNRIETAMSRVGFSVEYHLNTAQNRTASQELQGYSLFHMSDPFHARSLTLRRAYFYPFWRIENTAERWNFRVAKMPYPAEKQDPNEAEKFANGMRKRHFDGLNSTSEGFVYLPLQGRISQHRSFQTCSPLKMIEETIKADRNRKILASLHPKETYSEQELGYLEELETKYTQFTLSDYGSDILMSTCDYVVTQNSSVALHGYFFRKPAVLFGQIDFHHIAGNVGKIGVSAAFRHSQHTEVNYDRYLLWFFRKTSINGGNANAEDKIIDAMRKGGWDL